MIVSLKSPSDLIEDASSQIRERRLSANLTQKQLAERANVSLAVLRKFERTGKISFESFIKLAFVLGLAEKLLQALKAEEQTISSIDDLLKEDNAPKRRRASAPRKKA